MELQVGDFVKIKEGVVLHNEESASHWAGQVVEIYEKYQNCLIKLDAITLNSLDDEYLLESIEEDEDCFQYVFEWADLEKAERRDTEQEMKKAVEKLHERLAQLSEEYDDEDGDDEEDEDFDEDDEDDFIDAIQEKWFEEFESSENFSSLTGYQQEKASFITSVFMSYMYEYEEMMPDEWNARSVETICLEIIPSELGGEDVLFENIGDILFAFLTFLYQQGHIAHKNLANTVKKIKHKIAPAAKDPKNWGLMKSAIMMMTEAGVNMDSPEDIGNFLRNHTQNTLAKLSSDSSNASSHPSLENPYKNISRNQKITVKYEDGTLKENVKFKTVEQDLLDGKCELMP
jgi:hypothetical protein